MKYSAVIAAVVGVAAAQSISDVPQCALQCLAPAIQATGCSQTDLACFCKPSNMQSIVAAGTGCVIKSCGQDVAVGQVLPAVNKICAAAGGSSASGGASDSAPAPSSTAASKSSESNVPSSTSPAQTSGSASPTKSAPSTVAPTTSSGSSATTSAPQPSATGNSTQTTRPSTAAAAAATGLGSLAMLALGALAAF